MGRCQKNFDSLNRKIIDYSEVVGRQMSVKFNSADGYELSEEDGRHIFIFLECIYYHDQHLARNMNVKGVSGEISRGNKNLLLKS